MTGSAMLHVQVVDTGAEDGVLLLDSEQDDKVVAAGHFEVLGPWAFPDRKGVEVESQVKFVGRTT